jgi:hypothetical protein
MSNARAARATLAATAIALATACTPETGTAPAALTPSAPNRVLSDAGSVFTLQLRSIPTDPIFPNDPVYGYGHLQIRLGSLVDLSCLPPNPITPQPGYTVLSLCGRIFNEGGALYRGGAIYKADLDLGGDGFVTVATFGGPFPTEPCRRYDISGGVMVPESIAADMIVNTTDYRVLMDGDVAGAPTRIGGAFDGSAWGPVGTRPESDPYFAAKVCGVAITP